VLCITNAGCSVCKQSDNIGWIGVDSRWLDNQKREYERTDITLRIEQHQKEKASSSRRVESRLVIDYIFARMCRLAGARARRFVYLLYVPSLYAAMSFS